VVRVTAQQRSRSFIPLNTPLITQFCGPAKADLLRLWPFPGRRKKGESLIISSGSGSGSGGGSGGGGSSSSLLEE